MGIRIDLTGARFGRLVVVRELELINGKLYWRCLCDCGATWDVVGEALRTGMSKSCGCLRSDTMGNTFRTHGLSKTSEYRIWAKMKERCTNPNNDKYHYYGGRGIAVCDSWFNSFESFLLDMGRRPSPQHSLDRFPNQNGHYEPCNCRWATKKQQARNQRNNVLVEYNGITCTKAEWAERIGISPSCLQYRLKSGKSISEIILMQPSPFSG